MFPLVNREGRLNIVSGADHETSLIRTFLLTKEGEIPLFTGAGIPDIVFRPLNEISPEGFAQIVQNKLQEFIDTYNLQITDLRVSSRIKPNDADFYVDISFSVQAQPQGLSFSYQELIR